MRVFRVFEDRSPIEVTSVARHVERLFVDEKGKLIFSHSYARAVRCSSDGRMLEIQVQGYNALDGSGRSLDKLLTVETPPVKRAD